MTITTLIRELSQECGVPFDPENSERKRLNNKTGWARERVAEWSLYFRALVRGKEISPATRIALLLLDPVLLAAWPHLRSGTKLTLRQKLARQLMRAALRGHPPRQFVQFSESALKAGTIFLSGAGQASTEANPSAENSNQKGSR